jgi:two-component system response regulator RegA
MDAKPGSPSQPPLLLLVDDDQTFCATLSRQLEQRGFELMVAHSCAAALAAAQKQLPSHAVVDLQLPDGNGLRLIQTLRDLSPQVNVVMLTGFSSIVSAIDAVKLGATYYLCKAARVDDIVAAFDHTVGQVDLTAPVTLPSAKRVEWEHIQRVLAQNGGRIAATARALNMHRRTLQRKLQKRPPNS